MRRCILIVSVLLLGGLVSVCYTPQPEASAAIVSDQYTPIDEKRMQLPQNEIQTIVEVWAEQIPKAVYSQLPGSLKGVPLPQRLDTDDNGNLVVNQQVKKLFDYYLTAIGEESLTMIVARIKHQLSRQLAKPAANQALDILHHYLRYRNELAKILSFGELKTADFDAIRMVREQIEAARYSIFDSQTIEAFFSKQDQYDSYVFARQKLAQADMTTQQRSDAIAQLNAITPDWLLVQRRKDALLNDYRKRAGNASGQQEPDQQMINEFGIEAADRLLQLNEKRQKWQNTLSRYHQSLLQLINHHDFESVYFQEQIKQLRSIHFESQQLKRVAAIDRIKFGIKG